MVLSAFHVNNVSEKRVVPSNTISELLSQMPRWGNRTMAPMLQCETRWREKIRCEVGQMEGRVHLIFSLTE